MTDEEKRAIIKEHIRLDEKAQRGQGYVLRGAEAFCEECDELLRPTPGGIATLVGFYSPPGHNHDDNCRRKLYRCKNDHVVALFIRNTCPACDWKGAETCHCHSGKKLDFWPL